MREISFNTWVLFIVALMQGATLYFTRLTEKNTNSMKDELVKVTRDAAHAEGVVNGIARGKEK